MWPFKKNTAIEVNVKNMGDLMNKLTKAENELSFYKARIRAIQDRAYLVKRGEAYYNIQASTGKFAKMQLPWVGDDK